MVLPGIILWNDIIVVSSLLSLVSIDISLFLITDISAILYNLKVDCMVTETTIVPSFLSLEL